MSHLLAPCSVQTCNTVLKNDSHRGMFQALLLTELSMTKILSNNWFLCTSLKGIKLKALGRPYVLLTWPGCIPNQGVWDVRRTRAGKGVYFQNLWKMLYFLLAGSSKVCRPVRHWLIFLSLCWLAFPEMSHQTQVFLEDSTFIYSLYKDYVISFLNNFNM